MVDILSNLREQSGERGHEFIAQQVEETSATKKETGKACNARKPVSTSFSNVQYDVGISFA